MKWIMLGRVVALLFFSSSSLIAGDYSSGATVVLYAGKQVHELIGMKPREPVLVAGYSLPAQAPARGVIAIVFADTISEASKIKDRLLRTDVNLPYCNGDGPVACCDKDIQRYRLYTTEGWLDTGETCNPTQHESALVETPDPASENEPPTPFVRIKADLSNELYEEFRVDSQFMSLPNENGSSRILINRPEQRGDVQDRHTKGSLRFVSELNKSQRYFELIGHKKPTPRTSGCIGSINACKRDSNKYCRRDWLHWYEYDRDGNIYCELDAGCTCP